MQTATPFESLQAAVTRSGSQSAFARLCGVSQTAVWKWLQSGKRLPAEHVLVVERETGVSKHLLRPDIYPANPSSDPVPTDDTFGSVAACAPVGDFDRGTILKRSAAR